MQESGRSQASFDDSIINRSTFVSGDLNINIHSTGSQEQLDAPLETIPVREYSEMVVNPLPEIVQHIEKHNFIVAVKPDNIFIHQSPNSAYYNEYGPDKIYILKPQKPKVRIKKGLIRKRPIYEKQPQLIVGIIEQSPSPKTTSCSERLSIHHYVSGTWTLGIYGEEDYANVIKIVEELANQYDVNLNSSLRRKTPREITRFELGSGLERKISSLFYNS